jgi:hypothetical protein
MAQTNVQRRKAGYYYRQKIPADLLIHYAQGPSAAISRINRCAGTSRLSGI